MSRQMKVVSWNAQGGAATEEKLNALMRVIAEENSFHFPCVIFIYEAGPSGSTGFEQGDTYVFPNNITYTCIYAKKEDTAVNERCTTCVLTNINPRNITNIITHQYNTYRETVGIEYDEAVRIHGIHAIANRNESVTEIRELMREIDQDVLPWMFIGDFNSCPDDFLLQNDTVSEVGGELFSDGKMYQMQYDGTHDRNQKYCNIWIPGYETQGAKGKRKRKLDFFFTDDSNWIDVQNVKNIYMTDSNGNYLSDHNLIFVDISVGK